MIRYVVSLSMVLLVCAAHAAYTARLFLYNVTTNGSNVGAVTARPGDVIEMWYTFHKLDNVNPFKWGTLQVTLCLDALSVISPADQATWSAQITGAKSQGGPAADFLSAVIGTGELHDNAINPSDSSQPIVSANGLYFLLGIAGARARESNWDVKLFRFNVAPGSEGEVLDWCLDGRDAPTGLSTRILDQKNKTVDVTDNWVTVVPEPGFWAVAVVVVFFGRRFRR